MFHLVHKPLTTPSFLLLCIAFSLLFLFFFFSSFFFLKILTCCHPPFPCLCLSVFVCLSFPFCAPCYWGNELMLFQFYMLAARSVCLSLYPSFSPSFILSRHHSNSLMHFHKLSSSFFMAALKGLLPKGNGDEERHAG